jgi:hypothetical protein
MCSVKTSGSFFEDFLDWGGLGIERFLQVLKQLETQFYIKVASIAQSKITEGCVFDDSYSQYFLY